MHRVGTKSGTVPTWRRIAQADCHIHRYTLVVFALLAAAFPSESQTLTTLYSFSGAQGSGSTQGPLVQGPDGLFYGAIQTGGTGNGNSGFGAIFKITPGGALTTLHNFNGADGAFPSTGVVLGNDGNFYGTTYIGGPAYHSSSIDEDGAGTIFKITPTGAFTLLHAFTGADGGEPGGLTLGPDGNFYGTTSGGQAYGANGSIVTYASTIFRITPTGVLTTIYTFGGSSSALTFARLTLSTDGSFYGESKSAIFKVTPTGTLTTLYSFGSGGVGPSGGLTLGPDGNFYGTASSSGSSGNGTIFKATPTGILTTLYSSAFGVMAGSPNLTGFFPSGGLALGPDGNLYGMTSVGGTSSDGSIFRVTPTGVLTTLYSFSGKDGEYPNSGLTLGTDGNFYGIASAGGTYGEGTFFKLALAPTTTAAPSITPGGIVPVYSTATAIQPGEWVSIYGNNLASSSATWNGDFPKSLGDTSVTINGKAAYLWFVSPTQINLQAPDDTATGSVPVVVTTGGGNSTSTVTLSQFAPSFSLQNARYVTAIVATPGSPGNSGAGYDIIGPTAAFSYPTRPAKAGEVVELYGVGFGPTNPAVSAGQSISSPAASVTAPTVIIGGVPATLNFAGIVEAGLFQFNVVVPNAGSGDQIVQAMIGGMTTLNNVFVTLQ